MENDVRFEKIRRLGGTRYQAFLDDGYREYCMEMSLLNTPYLLQKVIRDADGVQLFFIDILVYDFSDTRTVHQRQVCFQPECQFNDHGDDETLGFRVTLMDRDTLTPQKIEEFFSSLYTVYHCVPYGE